MKIIWKYNIPSVGTNYITLPVNRKILTAQMQNDALQLWVMVDDDDSHVTDEVRIYVSPTGQFVSATHDDMHYISTVQGSNGLVWHVFESK